MSKSHAELPQSGREKTGDRTEKQTQLGQTLHERNYPNGQRHTDWWFISLAVREMQIKTTTRYYHTPTRMIKKNKAGPLNGSVN